MKSSVWVADTFTPGRLFILTETVSPGIQRSVGAPDSRGRIEVVSRALMLMVLISMVELVVGRLVILRDMKVEFVHLDGRQVPWKIGVAPGIN